MSDDTEFLERLNDVHEFPTQFVFKIIGDNTPEFVSLVAQSALLVLGKDAELDFTTRESSKGNHVSVTLEAKVASAQLVVDVFRVMQGLEGVRYVL